MINSFDEKRINNKNSVARPAQGPRLSLNLHIMPRTVTGHWKKWLFIGLAILALIILASLIFYSLAS
jgi:hypothetical protein